MTVYKHFEGYHEAIEVVKKQTLDENLATIDQLHGRDNLKYGASEEDVKQEALRQVEIDFRDCVNEDATFWVNVSNLG